MSKNFTIYLLKIKVDRAVKMAIEDGEVNDDFICGVDNLLVSGPEEAESED